MKKAKSLLLLLCTVLVMANTLAVGTFAANVRVPDPAPATEDITPYAEQLKWYYRDNNGVIEKRLWSITYQRWVTDWMPVSV